MLNRSILRIKAFETVYSSVLSGDFSLDAARSRLNESCESARDLFVFMCGMVAPLTETAASRIELLKTKFNPTEEERNPNMKFCENRLASILAEDPDLRKLMKQKGLSWDQYDIFLRKVLDSVYSKKYYADYMSSGESSLAEDCRLFMHIYEEELEDSPELGAILEEKSLYWDVDLSYVLSWCIRTFSSMGTSGRWVLPPLYASQLKTGRPGVDSDQAFVRKLVESSLANYGKYSAIVYANAKGWDPERLFLADVVVAVMCMAEILNFPAIPVNVSLNEYVEISKYFGTPKSRVFVNGIMDRIVRQLNDEGSIVKNAVPVK